MHGIEGGEDFGVLFDVPSAENGDDDEPNEQDRTKHDPNSRCTFELNGKQSSQKRDRDGNDGMAERRRRDLQSFDGRQHADRRRNHRVAEQQSSAEHQRPQQKRRAPFFVLGQKAVEGEEPALAIVLRAQNEDGVFDGDNDGDGPDHQRYTTQHVSWRWCAAASAEKQLIHGVKRRRADIAVDNAECANGQRRKASTRRVRLRIHGSQTAAVPTGSVHDAKAKLMSPSM